jgi:hypothetical protein
VKTAVPSVERHPGFEVDRRLDDSRHTAERAMNLDGSTEAYSIFRSRNSVLITHVNGFRTSDFGLGQSELGNSRTGLIEISPGLRK